MCRFWAMPRVSLQQASPFSSSGTQSLCREHLAMPLHCLVWPCIPRYNSSPCLADHTSIPITIVVELAHKCWNFPHVTQAKRMPRQTGKGSAQQKRLLTTRSAPELESLLPVSMKEAAWLPVLAIGLPSNIHLQVNRNLSKVTTHEQNEASWNWTRHMFPSLCNPIHDSNNVTSHC